MSKENTGNMDMTGQTRETVDGVPFSFNNPAEVSEMKDRDWCSHRVHMGGSLPCDDRADSCRIDRLLQCVNSHCLQRKRRPLFGFLLRGKVK